ncbi:hypothetical protein A6B43_01800 [Vespertiliibacter pulmonis]|uniref:Methyltransferase family protein n=1 Tax=Vespertiliibacter pulmonis TaxID=1443036 RepID=A0A3N4WK92_9PAST|nr:class I SAM-dependent methyltransferase [Vespertiliibacter pulmonis]QLB21618.1 hypothetical protein A6B43_01800 [Vespertiliibacter pulmonis]RPE86350.1 methyltransferase family protein [Vespertiliibacter pulmonis]
MQMSIYDNPVFFERYLKLRENPHSVNELIEKPTMFALLPDLKGKSVLDLGCGVGDHLQQYLALGARKVVGLDLSKAMLSQAEQNFAKNSRDLTAYRFYNLPMADLDQVEEQNFDLITSSFAFHYVENFPDLLQKIRKKLKPQGTLIFSQEHPIVTCYRGGERWEKNAEKEQQAYRLNYYREEGKRERNWFQQSFTTYHRTLSTILNQLMQSGFILDRIEEPMLTEQTQWHSEFKDLCHRPPLLVIRSHL